jgi:hypothetical protein
MMNARLGPTAVAACIIRGCKALAGDGQIAHPTMNKPRRMGNLPIFDRNNGPIRPKGQGKMTGTLRNLLVACGMLMLASPVLACSSALFEPMDEIEFGAKCSLRYNNTQFSSTTFEEVSDLGEGFVAQRATAVDGGSSQYHLVTDCKAEKVVVFGPTEKRIGSFCEGEMVQTGANDLMEQIVASDGQGQRLEITEIAGRARTMGLSEVVLTTTSKSLWFLEYQHNMKPFPLNCGCEFLYPEIDWQRLGE